MSCPDQPTVEVGLFELQGATIVTGWQSPCSVVTVGSSNGWDTNFDNLVVALAGDFGSFGVHLLERKTA